MEWISVKDRLPERSVEVLICGKYGDMLIAFIVNSVGESKEWKTDYERYADLEDYPYWMPLPKDPKGE